MDEFKRIYDRVPGWIFNCLNDEAWTLTRTNSRIEKILGYTEKEFAQLKHNSVAAVIPEPYRSQVRGYTAATMEKGYGAMHSYITPVVRKDGSYCWLNVELYCDDDDDEGLWYVSCADITEMKKKYDEELVYQDSMKDEDLLLKTRANITRDEVESIFTVPSLTLPDQSKTFHYGVLQLASRAYDAEEERKMIHLLSEERMRQALEEGGNYSFEYKRRDSKNHPSWAQVDVRTFLHPETKDLIAFVCLKNINEERKISNILNKVSNISQETLALIYLDSDEIEFIKRYDEFNSVQLDDRLPYSKNIELFANQYFSEELKNDAMQTFSIASIRAHLEEEDVFECIYGIGPEQNVYKRWQYTYFDKENGIVIYKRTDVSDTIQKASNIKTDFLSRMSHELRTPLNGISGYTTLLRDEVNQASIDKKTIDECIEEIEKAGGYLLRLLNDTLDAQAASNGRISMEPEITDMKSLLKSSVKLARGSARSRKVKFSYRRLNNIDGYCYCDKIRFQQVLMNLLNNAIKFTPEDGSVDMTVEVNRASEVQGVMTIVIADTGVGMSEEFIKEKLYTPFSQEESGTTSKYAGAGLGLTIAREIIHCMNGTIQCKSRKGVGTTFTLSVPVQYVPDAEIPAEIKSEKDSVIKQILGVHVLMCEDDPMNQDLMKKLLVKMGCNVTVAENGRIGLEEFKSNPPEKYNLILMDIRMPEMDGLEATRQIRSLKREDAKRIPILAVSANAFQSDVENSLAAGLNEHLSKPVNAKLLYDKINQYCIK